MEKIYEQIELRSEKVRNIIGRIPPLLIRSGITLIALLITALAYAPVFTIWPIGCLVAVIIVSRMRHGHIYSFFDRSLQPLLVTFCKEKKVTASLDDGFTRLLLAVHGISRHNAILDVQFSHELLHRRNFICRILQSLPSSESRSIPHTA